MQMQVQHYQKLLLEHRILTPQELPNLRVGSKHPHLVSGSMPPPLPGDLRLSHPAGPGMTSSHAYAAESLEPGVFTLPIQETPHPSYHSPSQVLPHYYQPAPRVQENSSQPHSGHQPSAMQHNSTLPSTDDGRVSIPSNGQPIDPSAAALNILASEASSSLRKIQPVESSGTNFKILQSEAL